MSTLLTCNSSKSRLFLVKLPALKGGVEGSYITNILNPFRARSTDERQNPALYGGKFQLDTRRVHFGFVDGHYLSI